MSQKTSRCLEEVAEQPAYLLKLVEFYQHAGGARLRRWAALARRRRRIIFSGMGTSKFAPEMILGALGRAGIDASTLDAGELLHYPRPLAGVPVLISQSGESIETRLAAAALRRHGALLAITNNETSSLARAAELVLPLQAGAEVGFSTKTYVNTLAALFLMTLALKGDRAVKNGLRALTRLAGKMTTVDRAGIRRAAGLLADAGAVHFVARGPAMAAAKQAALIFMEGTRLPAAAFTGGGFRHGPFELADANHRAVFFIPAGATAGLLAAMARETLEKGSRVVVITNTSLRLTGRRACVLRVPRSSEILFPLAAATTQALLIHAVASARGIEAGRFRYGQKITSKE